MSDRKHDTIVWLLERMEDALMERSSTNGKSQHESVSLLPGPLWNEAFRELDRCLNRMRALARQQAVYENPKGNGQANGANAAGAVSARPSGIPLGTARWHVLAWYVQVEHRQVMARQTVKGKHGKRGTVLIPTVEIQRHRDARKPKADMGVTWIVSEYAWGSSAVQSALASLSKEPAGLRLAA
ncbi:MAG: hypothetical protein NUW01_04510 [Gemmatimonadaceae bacterium]|nr:hypothetical protein [Gemmatimonadaceae bacterium]